MKKYTQTLIRAARTFAQAAVGYIVANVALIKWDDRGAMKTTALTILTAAVACGLSALMNLPKSAARPGTEDEVNNDGQ